MNLSSIRSELPKAVWMEFERRHEGHEVVDLHETLAREVTALLDIAKEHHSLSISPPRLPSPDLSRLLDPLGSVDPAVVFPCLEQEIRLFEELSESLRTVIMASREEAGRLVERLWPRNEGGNKGRRKGKREERASAVLHRYEGNPSFQYTSHFEGREELERLLAKRWLEAKARSNTKSC